MFEVQALFVGLVLPWAGGYKLTARPARAWSRSTMARLVGAPRVRAAYRIVGGAEVAVAALLLLPPATAVDGWLAAALSAGFLAYLGYARVAAPDTSCGCLSAQAGPVTWQGIARAGLLLGIALTATTADGFWLGALQAEPAAAATTLGVELGLFLALSPELRRPTRRLVGWVRLRLFPHPLARVAVTSPTTALSRLYRSTVYCANAAMLRSDVQDLWHSGDWTLVSYAGRLDDRPVTVVFALPDSHSPGDVRMSIVDDVDSLAQVSS
jgi:hypothetical protein